MPPLPLPQPHLRPHSLILATTASTIQPCRVLAAKNPRFSSSDQPASSIAMPPSYLMSRSFSYRKLKKLPPPPAELQEQYYAAVAAAQDCHHRHDGAIGRRRVTWRSFGGGVGGRRRRRPRLRISSLTRVLRRKAAAVGGAMRASVAKVVRRLKEGSPYVGDLFAGNYMFMQVTPSPTMAGGGLDKGVAPYYHQGTIAGKNNKLGAASWQHSPGVLYKV
ncbi:hypothetical protein E2562_027423 [Oryza meyeriana var. granulata]|uniref:Uncharacterized protein n=1 Tax=Oryza meyeriana var. granulata TaxID=110450 RepID=A0A6G1EQB0_9ORYZ|nr:hypothetical protein E2562_027423 [Oryza meyeriana var. granulata]